MKTILFISLAILGSSQAIRFEPKGYEILDPQSGHVLRQFGRGHRGVSFAPPITEEIFEDSQNDQSARNPRQLFNASPFSHSLTNSFFEKFNHPSFYERHHQSRRPHFRQERKVIPYHYQSSGGRYQPSKVTTYAHKKRQQNPYYGRKRRSAEPYTLIDPLTGRNVEKFKKQSSKKRSPFLFGLPFDLFNDGALKENVRTQRKSPASPPAPVELQNPYISTSGVPLYKYRQKNPLGYGRKKRQVAPGPWILLDPVTGRTLERPESVDLPDPLEQQFVQPEIREERNGHSEYVSSHSGVPLYHYRQKYPHGYTG